MKSTLAGHADLRRGLIVGKVFTMKMTSELATLAEAEEDLDDDDDDDEEDEEDSSHDEDDCRSEICAFDVPHFRYIDDDNVEEGEREGGWENGAYCGWYSSEEDCCDSSPFRYVVVSGTPLKILEHLLSDLRLDDQRGAPENRESGKCGDTREHTETHQFSHCGDVSSNKTSLNCK